MAPTLGDLVDRNNKYSSTHQPLPTFKEIEETGANPPRIAIISCADPRVFPEKYFNLAPGEAVVFRNIAGHPQSCWKDITTLDTFLGGFEQLIVVHHTDCGSTMFTNEQIREGLQKQHPQHKDIAAMDFGAVTTSIEQSVKDDLEWLKTAPLMRKELVDDATGFVYDLKTGKLQKV